MRKIKQTANPYVKPANAATKPVTQKDVVAYLLNETAMVMLATSPVKDAVQKAADSHRGRLFASMGYEERKPIVQMRDALVCLANLLAKCEDAETLNQVYSYVQALNNGEVLVAKEDELGNRSAGAVTGYETNYNGE